MSIKLDAVAYHSEDHRLRRLEEMVLLLHTVVRKTFHSSELREIYDKHIEEIRAELYNRRETPTQES